MRDWFKKALEERGDVVAAVRFANSFLAASPAERAEIRDSWDSSCVWTLPNPWTLTCPTDLVGTVRERLLTTLLFQALDYSSVDPRDALMVFAIVYNSCELVGIDAKSLFSEIAQSVGGPAAAAINSFVSRAPKDQTMEAFKLVAVKQPEGWYEIRPEW